MKLSTPQSAITAVTLAAVLTASFALPAYAEDAPTAEDSASMSVENASPVSSEPLEVSAEAVKVSPEALSAAPTEALLPEPLIGNATPAAAQALRPASGGTKRFTDVPSSHKFYKPITWMYGTGLTTGTKTGAGMMYLPADGLSREAMAAFLYRQAGNPSFRMPARGFSDVPASHKFHRAIMWMKASGLSTGYADGSYRPKDGLSREAMAAFLFRQAGRSAISGKSFSDVSGGHKFAREIRWMRAAGITTGYADGTYRPKAGVSREAMAAFLYRIAGSPAFIEPGTVAVSGTAAVAQTLRASVKGWAPSAVMFSYQWLRDGAAITGATGASYVLTGADQGKMIQVRVTGKVQGASAVSMTSVSTGAVAAKPASVQEIENRVLYLVNEERQTRGLHLLWKSDRGPKARAWSQSQADSGTIEHSTHSWYSNATQQGMGYGGEAITAYGPADRTLDDADRMVHNWMNSPLHKAILLDPNVASGVAGVAFPNSGDFEAIGTFYTSRYYPENLTGDLFPFPYSNEPSCVNEGTNQMFDAMCKAPTGRSLPRGTPTNGLWG